MQAVWRLMCLWLGLLAKREDGYSSDMMGLTLSMVPYSVLVLAGFTDVPVCSWTKSSNEAALAVCLIWQSMRPRDCSGFQTELVILSHVPIIKCCVKHLDYHLKGYYPFSFLGISCCLCYESLLCLSTPAIYYKFLSSQEGSLKSATLPVHFTPQEDESHESPHLP